MNEQQHLDYQRIASAIEFINQHYKAQPSLEEIAAHVHLSPFHFQRLFTNWAGTSPKKFLQYITLNHAKTWLKTPQATLFDTAIETGLSGTGRLHDMFVQLEGMTPAEYKHGGKNLNISYSYAHSPFGKLIVAATLNGICYLAFVQDEDAGLAQLQKQFPAAQYTHQITEIQQAAIQFFTQKEQPLHILKLHLKGSPFQLKVWQALLTIPMGAVSTYGNMAQHIQHPTAARAVGTAIGRNPVAFIIPCHRVIQATGQVGGYMWGSTRKTAILGWEAAACEATTC